MTINTESTKRTYAGNGTATAFDYDFKIFVDADLRVSLVDDATGAEVVQVLNTDYTVTGEGFEAGGKVTFVTPPPTGQTVLILSDVPYTQATDLKNQGRFFPETIENAFDRTTRQALQLKEVTGRSLTLPAQVAGVSTELPVPEVSKLIGWDTTGAALRNYSVGEIGTTLAFSNFHADVFTATVGQTDFTLTDDPGVIANLDVSIDGVTQVPTVDYTLTGTTLSFVTPMAGGEEVLARYGTALPVGVADASAVLFTQSGTGAVARTMQDKAREVVSLKDFGAVGDGVTDDYAAIMKAHDSLPALGGTIHVSGSYLHNTPIVFTKRVRLVGTATNYVSGASAAEFVKGAAISGDGVSIAYPGSSIEGVAFRGLPGNVGDGLVIKAGRVSMVNVAAYAMGRDGIRIGVDVGPSNCNAWYAQNIKAKNNGRHGLHISDKVLPTLPDGNGGTLNLADLQLNGECGLYLGNNAVNTFTGLLVQQNGTYGVFSSASSTSNFFYGGDYEVNGRGGGSSTSFYDFFIEAGSKKNTIFGGSCYNDPQSFRCDEPENMIVGLRDGIYTADDQYSGMQFFNVDSAVPTVLDWYKEGVFTPTVAGDAVAGAGTYSTQNGRYTRVGNIVTFSLIVAWSAHTGTGNMYITGLPFTANSAPGFTPVSVTSAGLTKPADTYVVGMIPAGTVGINLYTISTTSIAATNTKLAIDAAATVYVSGTYTVA